MMRKKVILVIKILLTLILLIYIFSKIPLSQIFYAIGSTNIWLFILSVLISIPVVLLSSYETKYLTDIQDMAISYKEILQVDLTTNFYSLFLPGFVYGGPIKWYKFSKYGKKSSAAVVVVYNRYLEIFVTMFIGITFSIPTLILSGAFNLLPIWVLALLVLFLAFILPLNNKILTSVKKIVSSLPMPQTVKAKIETVFVAQQNYQKLKLKDHFEIVGIMLTYHFISIISFYVLALSLNISIDFFVIGWVRSAVMLATMIPISISGFGIREGVLIYLLKFYGVSPSLAVAFSFLSFAKNLFAPLTGGILELRNFLFEKHSKADK